MANVKEVYTTFKKCGKPFSNCPHAAKRQLWYTSSMKYLLAIVVFVAGAMFPFALRAQSLTLISSSPGPESFHDHGSRFSHPFYGNPRAVVFPPFFGYPSNYPFAYFYPGLWPPLDYEYQQASRIANGDVAAEVAAQEKAYLSSQVEALTNEVRSLRQEQASREYMGAPAGPLRSVRPAQPVPQAEARTEQRFPAVVFVYRDGRQLEARNYAIFGQTLWIFHAETTQKIPLADLNLAASRRLNESRGIEFPLHNQH